MADPNSYKLEYGTILGLYTVGTFSVASPSPAQEQDMKAAADAIAAARFNSIMLASLHVQPDGSIYFNDTPMITGGKPAGQLSPHLSDYIDSWKNHRINTALVSFGGGGDFEGKPVGWYDFTNIANLIEQHPNPGDNPFFQNLSCLFSTYSGLDGIDIDLESYSGYDPFLGTLRTLIGWLNNDNYVVTIAPYDDPAFWHKVCQQARVSWINLQNAADTLPEFLGPPFININSFSAGLQVGSQSPQEVNDYFAAITKSYPAVGGGWLWNFEDFGAKQTAAYGEALAIGLGLASRKT